MNSTWLWSSERHGTTRPSHDTAHIPSCANRQRFRQCAASTDGDGCVSPRSARAAASGRVASSMSNRPTRTWGRHDERRKTEAHPARSHRISRDISSVWGTRLLIATKSSFKSAAQSRSAGRLLTDLRVATAATPIAIGRLDRRLASRRWWMAACAPSTVTPRIHAYVSLSPPSIDTVTWLTPRSTMAAAASAFSVTPFVMISIRRSRARASANNVCHSG